jgi:hypothetical protein
MATRSLDGFQNKEKAGTLFHAAFEHDWDYCDEGFREWIKMFSFENAKT